MTHVDDGGTGKFSPARQVITAGRLTMRRVLTQPHVDKAVRFAHREGARGIARRNALVCMQVGNFCATATGAIKGPAVVTALQTRLDHSSQRQRHTPMWTTVFQSKGLSGRVSEQNQLLAGKGHSQWRLIIHGLAKRHGPPAWGHHRAASLLLVLGNCVERSQR
ncbi:hypothetical protein D3C84_805400 [compost metagenome]